MAVSILASARNRTYESVLKPIWPVVNASIAAPRESPIPLQLVNKLSNARRYLLKEGSEDTGRILLFWGLKDWVESLPEAVFAPAALLSLPTILTLRRARRRRTVTGTKKAAPPHDGR